MEREVVVEKEMSVPRKTSGLEDGRGRWKFKEWFRGITELAIRAWVAFQVRRRWGGTSGGGGESEGCGEGQSVDGCMENRGRCNF